MVHAGKVKGTFDEAAGKLSGKATFKATFKAAIDDVND
jgi:hypothetical protein